MDRLALTPLRNLAIAIGFVVIVSAFSTAAYVHAGWSFGDAVYMVLLTIYTVGYGEVHPIDTPYLHGVTIATMIFGCTGMILVTGALVQSLTVYQIREILGTNRVKTEIAKLKRHVVVCGFGRIGVMLARELAAAKTPFLVVERDEKRFEEARALGYLALMGEATHEEVLLAAGVERASVLATVLPDDAANVFITLSGRSLNKALRIIARGESPSTETKLIQAGADKVVMPTHIGAERIAEMILFPETARVIRGSERMREFEKVLVDLGLEMEVVVATAEGQAVGITIAELEQRAAGAFFVVQVNPRAGEPVARPDPGRVVQAGDGLVVVGRDGCEFNAVFTEPAARPRAGRTTY
ncbi:potassium channel family protein [Phenylobacterium montanum]|uniref:NAD-binding protein n=1 Tax=Phenylobacterium montanum TaxID=2823693 RepID=A0A975FWB3_9CAUL|nr:potassium channel protein [Caulobacter sp. S6]QUD86137.1 NAD-binding protein [Caulobacter sp. S6]